MNHKAKIFTTALCAMLLMVGLSSCAKDKYHKEDLIGTWIYDAQPQYTVTFHVDGTLSYTAPGDAPSYTPTYTLDGSMIYIRVKIGSTAVDDVIEIKALTNTKLMLYYDGDILFDGKSINGEYNCTKK